MKVELQQWEQECKRDDGGVTSQEMDSQDRDTETYLEAATINLIDLEKDYNCLKTKLEISTIKMEHAQSLYITG